MSVRYTITIRTGKRLGSGTDATISVVVVGTLGETAPHKLDKWLHDDFKDGAEDVYEFSDRDVGDPIALRFTSSTSLVGGDWLLDSVTVAAGDRRWRFPFHRWIPAGSTV